MLKRFPSNSPLKTNENNAKAMMIIKNNDRSLIFDNTAIFFSIKNFRLRKYNLPFNNERHLGFDSKADIIFNRKFLPFHANGMIFSATINGSKFESTFYSIGGGFVVKEELTHAKENAEIFKTFPFPIAKGTELLSYCNKLNKSVCEVVIENEKSLRSEKEIDYEIDRIWNTMLECMYNGCHTEGNLPGGLNVRRRAFDIHKKLIGDYTYKNPQEWLEAIRKTEVKFRQILKWVSCFALSVNEVNASLGRVVTAPTNGSAGVIPSVLMYYMVIENHNADIKDIKQFLMVAGEIGSLFKAGEVEKVIEKVDITKQ